MATRKGARDGPLDFTLIDMDRLCTDSEAARASLVEVPSLRVLQSVGAIAAKRVGKRHGGFRRMWSVRNVCMAAVAAGLHADFGWNYRLAGKVVGEIPFDIWPWLYQDEAGLPAVPAPGHAALEPDQAQVLGSATDCRFELVNGVFLYISIPNASEDDLPAAYRDAIPVFILWKSDLLVNQWISNEAITHASYRKARSTERFELLIRDKEAMRRSYEVGRLRVSANVGIYHRACLRRLLGLEVATYERLVNLKGRKS